MSDNTTHSDATATQSKIRRGVFVLLVLLSVGGIAVMDYSETYALYYWLAMAPIFGGASLALAWKKAALSQESAGSHLRRQGFHWLVLVAGLLLVFLFQSEGDLEPSTGGLMALLILAVTTLLAGVHFEWRLAVLGSILSLTFIAGVLAESFFWILLIPAIISLALVVRGRGYDKI